MPRSTGERVRAAGHDGSTATCPNHGAAARTSLLPTCPRASLPTTRMASAGPRCPSPATCRTRDHATTDHVDALAPWSALADRKSASALASHVTDTPGASSSSWRAGPPATGARRDVPGTGPRLRGARWRAAKAATGATGATGANLDTPNANNDTTSGATSTTHPRCSLSPPVAWWGLLLLAGSVWRRGTQGYGS